MREMIGKATAKVGKVLKKTKTRRRLKKIKTINPSYGYHCPYQNPDNWGV